jgi:WD40 repeat protein/serine/threonine protein kinase/tetratricopeptide (TPR) repeat protein
MSSGSGNYDLLDQLADEFAERYRNGERPPLKEYLDKYPAIADQIRELFPALVEIEQVKEDRSAAEEPAPTGPLPPLEQLGDFRILREVGKGGMGVVYEAEQISLGRHVALKVMPQKTMLDARQRRRFEREAKALARLHHTNIVPVFGVGEHHGMPYYVMQFIQGLGLDEVLEELKLQRKADGSLPAPPASGGLRVSRKEVRAVDVARSLMTGQFDPDDAGPAQVALSLREREAAPAEPGGATIDRPPGQSADPNSPPVPGGRLSDTYSVSSSSIVLPGQSGDSRPSRAARPNYWQSVARIGVQVASALDYAHKQGILHRDIKPSNLLLDTAGTVWVTDFGLAKADDQQDLTHTGDILGTLRYMPPEAFEGRTDPRSDVYALGLTLYELLAFRPAYTESDRHQLIKKVTSEETTRLNKVNPEVPRDLVTIVHKAIDHDPSHRYQTAADFQADLTRFIEDEPIHARRVSLRERFLRWARRNRGIAAALSALALILVAAVVASTLAAAHFRRQERYQRDLATANERLAGEKTRLAAEKEKQRAAADKARKQAVAGRKEADQARKQAVGDRQEAVKARNETEARRQEAERLRELSRRTVYSSSMYWAHRTLESSGRSRRLLELLEDGRPGAGETDLRSWEWYYLNSRGDTARLTFRPRQAESFFVAWSRDGERLATADTDGLVTIWEASTGRELRTLTGHTGQVWSVAWSPDGKELASAGSDASLRIWDPDSGQELRTFPGHANLFTTVCWSPGGRRLASSFSDGQVRIWDARTGANLVTTNGTGHGYVAYSVAWSPDGKRLASSSMDGSARIWDAENARELMVLKGHTAGLMNVAWSPDGQHIASCSYDRTVKIWDAKTGRQTTALHGHTRGARSVCWREDGKRLATASFDSTVRIWDASTGTQLQIFRDHSGTVHWCSWSPDGRRLATSGSDHTIRVRDVPVSHANSSVHSDSSVRALPPHAHQIRTVSFSPNGKYIASSSLDGQIKIWEADTLKLLYTFQSYGSPTVAWSPDSTRLAATTGGKDNTIRVWDLTHAQPIRVLHAPRRTFNFMSWSKDGNRLAASGGNEVRIWNITSGDEVRTIETDAVGATPLAWSPDGQSIAWATSSGHVRLVDPDTGNKLATLPGPSEPIAFLSWSPPGKGPARLAAACNSEGGDFGRPEWTLRVWDVAADKDPLICRGHTSTVHSVSWHPDGTRLVSTSKDQTVKVWDAQTGQELVTLEGHQAPVHSACWSPDGVRIASAGDDKVVRLWDARLGMERDLSPLLRPVLDSHIARKPTGHDLKFRAALRAGQGHLREAAADFDQAARLLKDQPPPWFVSPWWVVGPFANHLFTGGPESLFVHGNELIDPRTQFRDLDQNPVGFQLVNAAPDNGLNLAQFFQHAQDISAYALVRIYSLKEQEAGILLDASQTFRLWLNGVTVFQRTLPRQLKRDDEAVAVKLKRGWNALLLKVGSNTREHGFYLRLSDDPVEMARVFERWGQWEQALKQWDRAVARRPKEAYLRLNHAHAALQAGRPDLARTSFSQAAAWLPEKAKAYQTAARFFIQGHRPGVSIPCYQKAIALRRARVDGEAGNLQHEENLASLYLELGHTEWQSNRLADAIQSWQRGFDILEKLAKEKRGGRDFRAALAAEHYEVFKALAEKALWSEASAHLARTLGADFDKWYEQAPLLLWSGDEKAYRQHCRAMLLNFDLNHPANRAFVEGVAKVCLLRDAKGKDLDEPTKLADLALKFSSEGTRNHFAKALADYRHGHFEAAVNRFHSTGIIYSQDFRLGVPANLVLAMAESKLQHPTQAKEALDWAEQEILREQLLDPGLPAGMIAESLICLLLRREAYEVLKLKAPPIYPEHLYRARVYAKLGQADKAEAEFTAAVADGPKDPRIWIARADVRIELGQTEMADADLKKSQELLAKAPTDRQNGAHRWRDLARCLSLRQRHQEAALAYRRALELHRPLPAQASQDTKAQERLGDLYTALASELRAAGQAKKAATLLTEQQVLWTAHDLRLLQTFQGVHPIHQAIQPLAVTPDGKHAVTGGQDGTIRVWDVRTGKEIRRLTHYRSVRSVVVSADGRKILSASDDNTIRLWDLATGQEIRRFEGHSAPVYHAILSPDARRIVSASEDRTMRLWDVQTEGEIRRFKGYTDLIYRLAITPDARGLLSVNAYGTICPWDVKTGKPLPHFSDRGQDIFSAILSADGRRVLACGADGMTLWDAESGNVIRRHKVPMVAQGIHQIVFLPDGKRALYATGKPNNLVALIDTETGEEIDRLTTPAIVRGLALLPDGLRAITTLDDGSTRIWSLPLAAPPDKAAALLAKALDLVHGDGAVRKRLVDQAARWPPTLTQLAKLRPDDPLVRVALARQ